jgi:CDP-paratose 2-epimerase
VRDQIHARDLAALFVEFFKRPQNGEVFNVGGGRKNSISVIETIEFFASAGFRLSYDYNPTARKGGHICYITDLGRVQRTFP